MIIGMTGLMSQIGSISNENTQQCSPRESVAKVPVVVFREKKNTPIIEKAIKRAQQRSW